MDLVVTAVTEQLVVVVLAPDVITFVAGVDAIVTVVAVDLPVDVIAGVDRVGSGTPANLVVTLVATDPVVAAFPVKVVVAGLTLNVVVAAVALNGVVATVTEEVVRNGERGVDAPSVVRLGGQGGNNAPTTRMTEASAIDRALVLGVIGIIPFLRKFAVLHRIDRPELRPWWHLSGQLGRTRIVGDEGRLDDAIRIAQRVRPSVRGVVGAAGQDHEVVSGRAVGEFGPFLDDDVGLPAVALRGSLRRRPRDSSDASGRKQCTDRDQEYREFPHDGPLSPFASRSSSALRLPGAPAPR